MSTAINFNGYQIINFKFTSNVLTEGTLGRGKISDPILDIRQNPDHESEFAILLSVNIFTDPEEENEGRVYPFNIDCELAGHFTISDEIEEGEKQFHLNISAPSMLYGVLRTLIFQLTSQAGTEGVMIPSYQFQDLGSSADENKAIEKTK